MKTYKPAFRVIAKDKEHPHIEENLQDKVFCCASQAQYVLNKICDFYPKLQYGEVQYQGKDGSWVKY